MPPRVSTLRASETKPKRSRTGCQTCRQRKLKCDEQRPICGQCQKSHRECVGSEPITYRHHQNSSLGRAGLDSFFKYSQPYTDEQRNAFQPVPKQLTWIYVSDPTSEEFNAASPPDLAATGTEYSQQVAAHSLEALSTAAAADQTTSYPPQGTAYYTAANPQGDSHPEYGFVQSDPAGVATGDPSPNIGYFLGNSSVQNETETSLIDPNLESTMNNSAEHVEETEGHDPKVRAEEDGMAESESRLAITLRHFNNQLQA